MDRRYLVTFGACLTQFVIIGLLFSYGLFFKVFETEFGWSRTFLSACTSVAFFMMGVLALFGGRLSDRYGPRLVLAVTGTLYGVGFVLMSQVSQPWQLIAIFGTFIGLGMSTHDVVTLSTIARWFERRRGIMTGVVKTGTALGQVALPPLAAFLILKFGWQTALTILGIAASCLLLCAALLMSRPPRVEARADAPETDGATMAEARSGTILWRLCAIQFLFFPALMTVPLHISVHGMDIGMSAGQAAVLLSTIGGASVLGRLVIGTFADRIGGRSGFVLCFCCLITALGALSILDGRTGLFVIVAIYGFGHGGFFTVVSPTVAEYFGTRAHGAIFGTILFFGTLGGAIGPILAGYAFDAFGSYFWAFTSLCVMATLGLALALSLPRADRTPAS